MAEVDLLGVMGKREEVMLVRGQLTKPELITKKDGNGEYIVFTLRVVKAAENKYQTQFTSYSVVVPADKTSELKNKVVEGKGNEVIAVIRPSGRVRRSQSNAMYNSIDLYLEDLYVIETYEQKKVSQGVTAL